MLSMFFSLAKSKTFWIVVIVLSIVGSLYYLIQTNIRLQRNLNTLNQNYIAANDTLKTEKTLYGEISRQYAFVQAVNDSFSTSLKLVGQELLSTQNTVAALTLKLQSAVVSVTSKGDSILTANIPVAYSDSGLVVAALDSIIFSRMQETWKAQAFNKYEIQISLINRITRDKLGRIEGSVETLSPHVKVKSMRTIVSDEFISGSNSSETSNLERHTLGIVGEVDYNTLAGGVLLNTSDWVFQLKYILFTADKGYPSEWYNKLRLSVGKYIF